MPKDAKVENALLLPPHTLFEMSLEDPDKEEKFLQSPILFASILLLKPFKSMFDTAFD